MPIYLASSQFVRCPALSRSVHHHRVKRQGDSIHCLFFPINLSSALRYRLLNSRAYRWNDIWLLKLIHYVLNTIIISQRLTSEAYKFLFRRIRSVLDDCWLGIYTMLIDSKPLKFRMTDESMTISHTWPFLTFMFYLSLTLQAGLYESCIAHARTNKHHQHNYLATHERTNLQGKRHLELQIYATSIFQ